VADATLAFDRTMKASLYASVGIPEYWIVNLQDRVLECHREPAPMADQPFGHHYRSITRHPESGTICAGGRRRPTRGRRRPAPARRCRSCVTHAPEAISASTPDLMLVVGLAACAMPLRRALRVDPTEALRVEEQSARGT
jgi:hypothetical protein